MWVAPTLERTWIIIYSRTNNFQVDLRTVLLLPKKALIGDIPIFLSLPQPAYVIAEDEVEVFIFRKDEVTQGLEAKSPELFRSKGIEKRRFLLVDVFVWWLESSSISSTYTGFQRSAKDKLKQIQAKAGILKAGLYVERDETSGLTSIASLPGKVANCHKSTDLMDLVMNQELPSFRALLNEML